MNLFSTKQEDQSLLVEQRLADITRVPIKAKMPVSKPAVKDILIPGYINSAQYYNVDLGFSKWGAAMAHNLVAEVYSATRLIYEDIASLNWEIVIDVEGTDKVLASKNNRQSTNKLATAIRNFEISPKIRADFFRYMAMDYLLYGQSVTELVGSVFDQDPGELHTGSNMEIGFGRSLERLNPLGVDVQIGYGGVVQQINYGWESVYVPLPMEAVAYDIFPNSLSDVYGHSPTLSAMNKINIVRNFDRFIRAFFANNGRPGMVIMPKVDATGGSSMKQASYDRIRSMITNSFKGVENAFNTFILQNAVDIQVLENPDTNKQFQQQAQIVDAIYESFRVARAMLGNTSNTPYKDGNETTRRHFLGTVLPLARIIETNVNTSILPFFDPTEKQLFRFITDQFDETSEADARRATVLDMQTKGTLVDLWTSSNEQGFEPPEQLRDMYVMPTGDIVHLSEIRGFWEKKATLGAPDPMGGMSPPPGDGLTPPEEDEGLFTDVGTENDDALFGKSLCDCPSCKTAWDYVAPLYEGEDLYPDEIVIEERINKELKAWVKFEKRNYGKKSARAFTPGVVPSEYVHTIRDRLEAITEASDIASAIYDVFEDEAIKTIQTYRRNLRAASRRLWRGLISKSEFTTRMGRAIDNEFTKAFNQGVKRSGTPLDELSKDQSNKLSSFIREEKAHVPNLADYIISVNKDSGGRLSTVRSRMELWPSRVPEIEEVGFLAGSGIKRLMWIYDPIKEHCGDCKFLNGRVYTAKVWNNTGIHPRSRKLACFGLRCGCGWKETNKPLTLGRPPSVFGKGGRKAFDESSVTRNEGGEFSSGGGGSSSDSDEPESSEEESLDDSPETGSVSNAGSQFIAPDKVRDQRDAYVGAYNEQVEQEWKESLSGAQMTGLGEWSHTSYDNYQAWGKGEDVPVTFFDSPEEKNESFSEFLSFEEGIENAPAYEGVAWRGATNRNMNAEEVLEGYRSSMGGTMKFDTYSSASGDSAMGVDFSQYHTGSGTPVIYEMHSKQGKYTNSTSQAPGQAERELIFKPGAEFTIRDAYTGSGLDTDGNKQDAIFVILEDTRRL